MTNELTVIPKNEEAVTRMVRVGYAPTGIADSNVPQSFAFAGKPAWHGCGIPLPPNTSPMEALDAAGLDFSVEVRPSAYPDGDGGFLIDKEQAVVIRVHPIDKRGGLEGQLHNYKLGTVSPDYQPIQNHEMANFLEHLMGVGHAVIECAGTFNNGRKVFFLLRLPGELEIHKDGSTIRKYLLLASSHDGKMKMRGFLTPIRVVCQNTMNLALSKGQGEGIAIKHSKQAPIKIEQARHLIFATTKYYDQMAKLFDELAKHNFTNDQMKDLVEQLLLSQGDSEDAEPGTRCANNRKDMFDLFEKGKGHESIAGTAYAAINAVIQYVDHVRGTRLTEGSSMADLRANAILFGTGARIKEKALTLIRKEVGV